MKPWLATTILLFSLISVMLLAGTYSQNSERAYQCQVQHPLPTLEAENGHISNFFAYTIQQAETEVCTRKNSFTIDCGITEFDLGFRTTDAGAIRCAVKAYRGQQSFVYEEHGSGFDYIYRSWILRSLDGTLYFIHVGDYLSVGQAVKLSIVDCTESVVEKNLSNDLEEIRCKNGNLLQPGS